MVEGQTGEPKMERTLTLHDFKTVAEQSAFEFGRQVAQIIIDRHAVAAVGRRFAFTHQFAAFPRSDKGFERLQRAFMAGTSAPNTPRIL